MIWYNNLADFDLENNNMDLIRYIDTIVMS